MSSPLSVSISVSSDELMDQTYIKAAISLQYKMASPSSPPSVSSSRVFDPSSNAPPMAILRSSHKATVVRKFLSRIPLDSSVVIVAENVLPKMEELVRLVQGAGD
jgi:hypothetical protein